MLVPAILSFSLSLPVWIKEWSLIILHCIFITCKNEPLYICILPIELFFLNAICLFRSFDSFPIGAFNFLYVRAFNILKILNVCHKCCHCVSQFDVPMYFIYNTFPYTKNLKFYVFRS